MAMNMITYLQQCGVPPAPHQQMPGADYIDDVMGPPGLNIPLPAKFSRKFSRSGSKESCASTASTMSSDSSTSMPPGVWNVVSDVSTLPSSVVISPQKIMQPPGIFRTGSQQSTAPSTPPEDPLAGLPLSLDERSQSFYMELVRKTMQLQQVADEDAIAKRYSASSIGSDDSVSTRYSASSIGSDDAVSKRYSASSIGSDDAVSKPKMALPLASLVGMEAYPVPPVPESSALSPRIRSPKKGRKGSKQSVASVDSRDEPLDLEGLLSRGSKNHDKGQCRPCRDFWTPKGCANGVLCNFCHCEHGDVTTPGTHVACCDKRRPSDSSTIAFRPPPGLPLPTPPGL
mmetsp:Transcript_19433/g.31574  ORF Transcript_19433/g.31574 Transcript_19433/m.31574 type:complete len:343 (+) Transcript_19433:77-1105(+)